MQFDKRLIESGRKLITVILAATVLSGCQPEIISITLPSPAVMLVQTTPALLALEDDFQGCANELPGTGLVLLERPAPAIDLSQSALALRWGAAGEWQPGSPSYTAVIGQEELVFVTNLANPVESITLADLQSIYSGALQNWPSEGETPEIQPWVYPPGEDIQIISQAALGGITPPLRIVHLAPDSSAMREAVAANPGAIGFLPGRWVDSSVKRLAVEGVDPALLAQPVLAWSKLEPEGPERAWLICLQERLSE